MPLVTITAKPAYCPAISPAADTPDQALTAGLGAYLPGAFVEAAVSLGMSVDMPPEAVQVEFRSFHPRSINIPDIWVHVQFTELSSSNGLQKLRRAEINRILTKYLDDEGLSHLNYALDVFWGPGSGCFSIDGLHQEW